MEIRLLRYFIEIVREGTISGASERLHISQPSLSRQVREMERELGVTLFERGYRRIQLTQEGEYLFNRAKEIVSLADDTTNQLSSNQIVSGTINIGSGETMAIEPLMGKIAEMMKKYPNIRINLVSGDNETIRHQLDTGVIEFAVLMGHENLTKYNTLPLQSSNRWGLLMDENNPLVNKKEITPKDLVGQKLMTSAQTERQDTFRHWAGDLINQYKFVGNYNLLFNVAMLIKTGACTALAYDGLANTDKRSGLEFRPLVPEIVDNNILVWKKNYQLQNVGKIFIKEMGAMVDGKD
ncbi:MAG: LysR family transcriptional regulator [Limosilactobacillus sp.]|uniref:LysR family transcriptional regulator n=1 Tax=Limosilactobacillus sp. TaxID=2773925 RepID=UPI00270A4CC6|nr:LysR family transcriptional regulator [Limosilactobacillus sp.]